jgi:hypothetical protein
VSILEKVYETGRKYAAGFKKTMKIIFDKVLPKWNYRAVPEPARNREVISGSFLSLEISFLNSTTIPAKMAIPTRRAIASESPKWIPIIVFEVSSRTVPPRDLISTCPAIVFARRKSLGSWAQIGGDPSVKSRKRFEWKELGQQEAHLVTDLSP